jgi:hypothetical protein
MNDARHAPALAGADRSPQDAQLADPQPSPGCSPLQSAVVRVGRQRLVCEHVSHRSQRRAVVVGVELAQIALRLAVKFDRDLRHGASARAVEGTVLGLELGDGIGERHAGLALLDRLVRLAHRGDVLGCVGEYVVL